MFDIPVDNVQVVQEYVVNESKASQELGSSLTPNLGECQNVKPDTKLTPNYFCSLSL